MIGIYRYIGIRLMRDKHGKESIPNDRIYIIIINKNNYLIIAIVKSINSQYM